MSSQYALIAGQWPELHVQAVRVERFALGDPRTACFYARRTIELLVEWVYANDSQLQRPWGEPSLSQLIHAFSFRDLVGPQLLSRFKLLKDLGNDAVHRAQAIPTGDSVLAATELFQVLRWLALTYGLDPAAVQGARFDKALLPAAEPATQQQSQTREQLALLANQLAERDQQLREEREASAASLEELERLRLEITALRKANQAAAQPEADLTEFATRQLYIDHYLEEVGWRLGEGRSDEVPVSGMPNETGEGFVDYVLWGADGKPLALVEAKRSSKDPMLGQQQAKLYADCLETQYGQRPLIFLSNGYRHRLWDDLRYPPREVQGFYRKAELETLIRRRTQRQSLAAATVNPAIVERYYQQRAIRAICESMERSRRKVLLVMATGSGKTRTVIALVDLLIRCNWVKRVLFLADRNALVLQAERAFRRFLPDCSPVNLVSNKGGEGRVFLSTYPTMMNLIDAENSLGEKRFGVGHFDLVIIDEAHRSVYQKYGAIFAYFDSLLSGLTATPRNEIDRNTYDLFDLEVGLPTDEYGLDQAVDDGYLVPFRAISVPLRFPRDGITYAQLSAAEQAQWDLLDWEEGVLGTGRINSGAVNAWLFNADTVDKGLQVLMTQGCLNGSGDQIGKTIVFARNHNHAVFIQDRFDHHYPHLAGQAARVIDNRASYAQSLIDEFADPNSNLAIAISVDMLDTGIDIPEIVNLVFFKPVRSRTKFWQMVGRGTRLCPDLFGPGAHKECFWIFDCCQNLEFFLGQGGSNPGPSPESLSARLFRARLALLSSLDELAGPAEAAGATELRAHRVALAEALRRHVAACPSDNFLVRPHLELVERFRQVEAWNQLDAEAQELLASTLAPLPSAQAEQDGDTDADARRFDLLLYKLQLAVLRSAADLPRLQAQVREIAGLLEERHTIPMVAAEMELIQDLLLDEWWQGVTLPMLEQVRLRLRSLIGLIERQARSPIYTIFTDVLGELKELDAAALISPDEFRQFRLRARNFLRAHEDHLTMQRLRRNQPLTATDLQELERFLLNEGIGNERVIARASEECNGFGLFIRSLVGLERNAAKEVFADFLAERTHTATQIQFINEIINELTSRGVMDPARLYDPPFSDLAPTGPEALFTETEVLRICDLLAVIRARAETPKAA
ncbi:MULTISPECIES: DEAD/DEAH box helicase family protein [unclassified Synechococcus]|uniref:DEAD/DEAH box helicase family protein n=1 Tax=unclassified Synechococcus TaxID=2626047 RepID=UPI0021A8CAA8|nr:MULTISPECIES: DEAD/DEAH box helicase family protein [unclassified Synechococcus]MCT0212431.1 DEAD/DEAH box helicase family protein [Synechococcus sp. CS-1326]MCT0234614.1 DEAD/DEAH box helicase family protein [Synechococcus sp. CS-1327]